MAATVAWPGFWLPPVMPAAFFIKYDAGGVFITYGTGGTGGAGRRASAPGAQPGWACPCSCRSSCDSCRSAREAPAHIFEGFVVVGGDDNRHGNVLLQAGGTRGARSCGQPEECALVAQAGALQGVGVGRTFKSAVLALKSLQKSMILRPAWPSAGPTGGEGFACPATMTSRIVDVTALLLAIREIQALR